MRGFSTLKECNVAGFKKKEDKKCVFVGWSERKRVVSRGDGCLWADEIRMRFTQRWGSGAFKAPHSRALRAIAMYTITTYDYMTSTAFYSCTFGNQALFNWFIYNGLTCTVKRLKCFVSFSRIRIQIYTFYSSLCAFPVCLNTYIFFESGQNSPDLMMPICHFQEFDFKNPPLPVNIMCLWL